MGPAVNFESLFPTARLQFQFQPCEYEARGTKWRRGRRQEAGERGGAISSCLHAHLSNRLEPYLALLDLTQQYTALSRIAPLLPRLTGRSSTGKKVRQGQAAWAASLASVRRRASSVNQSSSVNFSRVRLIDGPHLPCLCPVCPVCPVCPSIRFRVATKIWFYCAFLSFSNVSRRISEIRARSVSNLGNTA